MTSEKDVWQFGIVFFCLLSCFLLVPLLTSNMGLVCLNGFFVALLFYTLWLARPGRLGLCFGGGLLAVRFATAVYLAESGAPGLYMEGQYLLVLIVANCYIATMLLAYAFRRRGSHGSVILAALASYMLMGFILTDVFLLTELVHPGSFWVQSPVAGRFNWSDAAAYSFHLLSPMGPPGVVAVGLFARSVAIVGAMLGFCYMAILVSKIVNWAPLLKPKEYDGSQTVQKKDSTNHLPCGKNSNIVVCSENNEGEYL